MPATENILDRVTVGIDVGGTKILVHALDSHGQVVFEQKLPSRRAIGTQDLAEMIGDAVNRVRLLTDIEAVGIGFPGLTDANAGVVLSSVILDGWREVPAAALLSERLGLPCAIDNDVNNAARAELAVRGEAGRNMLFVTVGSGVGGALILEGKLWAGAGGLAGEIGHVAVDQRGTRCLCGRVGCAGPRASGHAIAARLGITPAEVSAIANSGNVHAWSVIRKTTVLLGRAIGSALNLLNLPLVVIGGGIAELGPRYFNLLECAVRAETFPEIFACCRIEKARAGYGAGATGAALMARERFLDCVRTRSACE